MLGYSKYEEEERDKNAGINLYDDGQVTHIFWKLPYQIVSIHIPTESISI